MPQNFLSPQRDQPMLMPVDMREWLPEDDLAFIVLDAVATLDLGEFRRRYRADGHGRAASGPEMMVALLLYGYCQGERSSRVIERRCVRDVAYRVIAGGLPAPWNRCRAAEDLPGTDHDVPARPGRVRKRMAAGLHSAQSAEAAPAPPAGLTIQGPPPSSQDLRSPKDRGPAPRICIPGCSTCPRTELCATA